MLVEAPEGEITEADNRKCGKKKAYRYINFQVWPSPILTSK